VALLLREHGILRVRPLAGGLAAWRELGYPLAERIVETTTAVDKKR
jgi:rhodanese-related sulfurtransferase